MSERTSQPEGNDNFTKQDFCFSCDELFRNEQMSVMVDEFNKMVEDRRIKIFNPADKKISAIDFCKVFYLRYCVDSERLKYTQRIMERYVLSPTKWENGYITENGTGVLEALFVVMFLSVMSGYYVPKIFGYSDVEFSDLRYLLLEENNKLNSPNRNRPIRLSSDILGYLSDVNKDDKDYELGYAYTDFSNYFGFSMKMYLGRLEVDRHYIPFDAYYRYINEQEQPPFTFGTENWDIDWGNLGVNDCIVFYNLFNSANVGKEGVIPWGNTFPNGINFGGSVFYMGAIICIREKEYLTYFYNDNRWYIYDLSDGSIIDMEEDLDYPLMLIETYASAPLMIFYHKTGTVPLIVVTGEEESKKEKKVEQKGNYRPIRSATRLIVEPKNNPNSPSSTFLPPKRGAGASPKSPSKLKSEKKLQEK